MRMNDLKTCIEEVERIKSSITESEAKILEYAKKIAKAEKKKDFHAISHCAHLIVQSVEEMKIYKEEWLPQAEHDLKIAQWLEENEGFDQVAEALEGILVKDIYWHNRIKEMYLEDRSKAEREWTKVNVTIARMSEQEALNLFRKDLEQRFEKLLTQVKKKAGNIVKATISRNPGGGFDGVVEGTEKTVHVTTVGAGGHNIQRYHYRCLVK